MEEVSYKKLFNLAIKKLAYFDSIIYDNELPSSKRLRPRPEDWESVLITDYEEDKQSLIAALEEYASLRKLWLWMEENNYHTNQSNIEKFCDFVDEENMVDEYDPYIYYHLHTEHLWLSLSSERDHINFQFPDTFEVWGSREGEKQMYDMFADEYNESCYITFDKLISELREYCTKEEFTKVINKAEEYSYNKYLDAKEFLKEKFKGKSFSL